MVKWFNKNLSLRRKRQFAMLGPASKNRVEVGLNMKGLSGTDWLVLLPPGGMCQYKVFLDSPNQVDAELLAGSGRLMTVPGNTRASNAIQSQRCGILPG